MSTVNHDQNPHKLILLRGNSGSGKSTLAHILQHKLGRGTLVISQDVIRRDMLWANIMVPQSRPLTNKLS